jgi:hypothetical protein
MGYPLTPLRALREHANQTQPADPGLVTLTAEQRAKKQADFILRSAAKARGEIVDDDEPLDPTAKAIILAGKRRRSECP